MSVGANSCCSFIEFTIICIVGRMKMNYPNGIRKNSVKAHPARTNKSSYGNRGMTLEEDINVTNKHYLAMNLANIHKKPTPIQVVKVHYPKRSAAVITEGYFQAKATTDYNGIYKGKHLDFEAKETKNKTMFPLKNFHDHQFEHMESVIKHGGICFTIIRFVAYDETYLLEAEKLLQYWRAMVQGGKKSIPYDEFRTNAHLIPFTLQARIDYLSIIDQLYFNK